jgi:excisionase family DNA binding protein
VTRETLLADLVAIVEAEPREMLREVIGALEAAKAAALERLIAAAPAQDVDEEDLWDAKRVAAFLGIPPSKVETMARQRAIPSGRFGKYVRFSPAVVRAWAERELSLTKRRS